VLRHAKSSWKTDGQADMDRPLNKRGERDAPDMGRRLKALGVKPKRIIASPAKRAVQTAKRVAYRLNYKYGKIETESRLYLADPAEILRYLHVRDDKAARLLIVGHNPGLTEFVNWMAGQAVIDDLPTAGFVALAFDAKRWRAVKPGTGTIVHVDYPKRA
jgi:phosphohistidine phosphatase